MSSSLRWILLLVMALAVVGVALWLDGEPAAEIAGGSLTGPGSTDPGRGPEEADLPSTWDDAPQPVAAEPEALRVEHASSLAASTKAEQAPRLRVQVLGRLVSVEGRPVADATVSLMDGPVPHLQAAIMGGALGDIADEQDEGGEPRAKVTTLLGIGRDTTDKDGRFRIDAPLPKEDGNREEAIPFLDTSLLSGSRLYVQHPAFVAGEHPVPSLVAGEVDAGTLVLEAAGRITGRVLAADGTPLDGARLAVQEVKNRKAGLGELFSLISGSPEAALTSELSGTDGRFQMGGMTAGRYTLAVQGKGHPLLVSDELDVVAGLSIDVGDLRLARGSFLAGRVLDGEGQAVPDLKVNAAAQLSSDGLDAISGLSTRLLVGGMSSSDWTDEGGNFRIEGVPSGTHDLKLGGRDTGWSHLELDDVASGRRDVELVVHRLGHLLVTVQDTDGRPILGELSLKPKRSEDDHLLSVYTRDELAADLASTSNSKKIARLSSLPEIPQGAYLLRYAGREGTELRISGDGYATSVHELPAVLGPGVDTHLLRLQPESVLAGRVVDEQGAPIVGATVRAKVPGGGGNDFGSLLAEGFDASRSSSNTKITTVTTTSTGGDDPPTVTSQSSSPSSVSARSRKTTTDAEGRFRLAGLSAGTWELSASSRLSMGSEPQTLSLNASEQRTDLELVLPKGGSIVGVVVDSSSQPVEGVRIAVAVLRTGGLLAGLADLQGNVEREMAASLGAMGDDRVVSTDSDGHFEVHGLRPEHYSVTLKKQSTSAISLDLAGLLSGPPPEDERTRHVQVLANESTQVDFVRPSLGDLEVRVTAAGQAVAGADVSLSDLSNSFMGVNLSLDGRIERTNSDGVATFQELEPGGYGVQAMVPGALHLEESEVEMEGGRTQELHLTFGGITLRGSVVDDLDNSKTAGALVHLRRADPEQDAAPSALESLFGQSVNVNVKVGDQSNRSSDASGLFGFSEESVATDSNGEFEMKFLSPGRWEVWADGDNWVPGESAFVTLEDSLAPDSVRLHVRRGATLKGQVIEGSSEDPLDGVRVELQDSAGKRVQRTDSDNGGYVFRGVAAGDYQLVIPGDGDDRARRPVHVGSDAPTLTIHLVTLD